MLVSVALVCGQHKADCTVQELPCAGQPELGELRASWEVGWFQCWVIGAALPSVLVLGKIPRPIHFMEKTQFQEPQLSELVGYLGD